MLKKSILLVGVGNAIRSVIQIVLIAIVSRLIVPAEFGKFAVLLVIINFANIFNQIGLGPAIIQKKKISSLEIKSSFSFSVVYSFGITLVYLIVVPYYLKLLNQEELLIQSIILALFFPISALVLISEAEYKRELKFKAIVKKNLKSVILGYGLTTIVLGYLNFGIWALVLGYLAQSILLLLLYSKSFKSLFNFEFELKNIMPLMSFGVGNSAATLFSYFGEEGDKLLFGKFYSMELLGAYSRAFQLYVFPTRFFSLTFDTVFFPYFSRHQENLDHIKKLYLAVLRLSFSILLPISFILMINSAVVIDFFLGSQWENAVSLFSILILGLAFRFGIKTSKSVIKAVNEVYKLTIIQFACSFLVLLFIVVFRDLGYESVPYIIIGVTILNFVLVFFLASYRLKITMNEGLFFIFPGMLILMLLIATRLLIFDLIKIDWPFEVILYLFVILAPILLKPLFFLGFSLKSLKPTAIKSTFNNNK